MRIYSFIAAALIPMTCVAVEGPKMSLDGVWQAVEVTHGTPAVTIKPGPNLAIFSGRFYSRIDVQTQAPRPVLADVRAATADELRQVWGPVVAEAGTFELTGNLITFRPSVAKNPAAMSADVFFVYAYQLDGGTLTLNAQRDLHGPVASTLTVKLVRVK